MLKSWDKDVIQRPSASEILASMQVSPCAKTHIPTVPFEYKEHNSELERVHRHKAAVKAMTKLDDDSIVLLHENRSLLILPSKTLLRTFSHGGDGFLRAIGRSGFCAVGHNGKTLLLSFFNRESSIECQNNISATAVIGDKLYMACGASVFLVNVSDGQLDPVATFPNKQVSVCTIFGIGDILYAGITNGILYVYQNGQFVEVWDAPVNRKMFGFALRTTTAEEYKVLAICGTCVKLGKVEQDLKLNGDCMFACISLDACPLLWTLEKAPVGEVICVRQIDDKVSPCLTDLVVTKLEDDASIEVTAIVAVATTLWISFSNGSVYTWKTNLKR